DQPVQAVQRLAAAASGHRVEELPDVFLAAILDRLLDQLAVDPTRDGREVGELAVLAGEPGGRIGVDALLAAVPFLAERPAGELRHGVGGDPHAGLALELAGEEIQPLPPAAALRRLDTADRDHRLAR